MTNLGIGNLQLTRRVFGTGTVLSARALSGLRLECKSQIARTMGRVAYASGSVQLNGRAHPWLSDHVLGRLLLPPERLIQQASRYLSSDHQYQADMQKPRRRWPGSIGAFATHWPSGNSAAGGEPSLQAAFDRFGSFDDLS